jgi:hypothetical protein
MRNGRHSTISPRAVSLWSTFQGHESDFVSSLLTRFSMELRGDSLGLPSLQTVRRAEEVLTIDAGVLVEVGRQTGQAMRHDRARGRSVALLGTLLCLVAFGTALASLCFAEEIESPAHYDGDDDDAGIHQKRSSSEPVLDRAIDAHLHEVQPSQRLTRPAPDHPEPRHGPLHRRPAPRGPPA